MRRKKRRQIKMFWSSNGDIIISTISYLCIYGHLYSVLRMCMYCHSLYICSCYHVVILLRVPFIYGSVLTFTIFFCVDVYLMLMLFYYVYVCRDISIVNSSVMCKCVSTITCIFSVFVHLYIFLCKFMCT